MCLWQIGAWTEPGVYLLIWDLLTRLMVIRPDNNPEDKSHASSSKQHCGDRSWAKHLGIGTQIAGRSCSHTCTNKHIPQTNPALSEIAAGNMWAQIAPYSRLMFLHLIAAQGRDSLLTLCRRDEGGFSLVWSHAGPGLGLYVNTVHILENTGKPPGCLYSK